MRVLSTTALCSSPTTMGQFRELYSESSQFVSGGLGVTFARLGLALLSPGNLLRRFLDETLGGRTFVKPPRLDQRGQRRVDLTLGQLRIFPPIPAGSSPGTGK